MPRYFTANGRLPGRPLSYKNKYLSYKKEFLINWDTNELWICDKDGNFINCADVIFERLMDELDGDNIIINMIDRNGDPFQIRLRDIVQQLYDRMNDIIDKIRKLNERKLIFPIYDNSDPATPKLGETWITIDTSDN